MTLNTVYSSVVLDRHNLLEYIRYHPPSPDCDDSIVDSGVRSGKLNGQFDGADLFGLDGEN